MSMTFTMKRLASVAFAGALMGRGCGGGGETPAAPEGGDASGEAAPETAPETGGDAASG